MTLAVADEQESGVVGHLPPFVKIERDGIGALDTGEKRRQRRRQDAERTEGAVDMKPDVLLGTELCKLAELVDRPDVDGAGRADHEEGCEADLAVAPDLRTQGAHIDPVRSIDADAAECI